MSLKGVSDALHEASSWLRLKRHSEDCASAMCGAAQSLRLCAGCHVLLQEEVGEQ